MKRLPWLFALAAMPLTSMAQDFDYTYVEGYILNTELDGPGDIDGDGIELNGSFELNEDLYVLASYTSIDYDQGIDGSYLSFGLGFHTNLRQDLDFIADIQYLSVDIDGPGTGDGDDSGLQIGAGVRAWIHDDVELKAKLDYYDLDDSDTVLSVSGYYHFTDVLAFGAELSDGDAFTWAVGARYRFGNR